MSKKKHGLGKEEAIVYSKPATEESRLIVNGGGDLVNEWKDIVNRRDGISGNSIRKLK